MQLLIAVGVLVVQLARKKQWIELAQGNIHIVLNAWGVVSDGETHRETESRDVAAYT